VGNGHKKGQIVAVKVRQPPKATDKTYSIFDHDRLLRKAVRGETLRLCSQFSRQLELAHKAVYINDRVAALRHLSALKAEVSEVLWEEDIWNIPKSGKL
jgi:hypothetical protein